MLQSFALKHRNISSEDCEKSEELHDDQSLPAEEEAAKAKKNKKKPECFQVGVCLCSEEGVKLYQLSGRFLNTLKLQFPASGNFRVSLLKASRIFILLRACSLDEAKKVKPNFTTALVWHVGIQYLTPFRPTFRKVTASGDLDSPSIPLVGGSNFFTFWPAMQKLSLDMAWFARFYRIRESSKFLSAFEPAKASMVALQPGTIGTQFWPPTRVRKAKARDVLDDDLDSNGSGGDDDAEVAVEREMHALLDQGLAAMQAEMEDGNHPRQDEPGDDADDAQDAAFDPGPAAHPADSDSGSSSSDSSSSSSSSSASRALRGSADLALKVPGGTIRFYENKKQFTATCDNPNHGKCVLTRQSHAYKGNARSENQKAKGRPLGQMCAWLAIGQHIHEREDHWDPDRAPDHATRLAARLGLEASATGRLMLGNERDRQEGEGDEPAGLA